MMLFFAAWLARSMRLALALGFAFVAMQAPAVTREYQAALLQLVRGADQDISRRIQSARQFYGIAPGDGDGDRVVAELRAVEPSNAETLGLALRRRDSLRVSYEEVERSPTLLRPIVVLRDIVSDRSGPRSQIVETVFDGYALQLDLGVATVAYGVIGLFLGSLIGEALVAAVLPRRRPAV